MKPHRAMVGALLAFLLTATAGFAASKDEEQAIAAFKKLGRTIKRDEQKPGKPAYRLTLKGLKVKDADLAHLKALKHLRFLNLANTKITDKGLFYLKNLKE